MREGALFTLVPERYRYHRDSLSQMEAIMARIFQLKARGLTFALDSFVFGVLALALLLIRLML